MHIRRAQPDDAAALTCIAVTAKRHWGYPERWMEQWRNALTIDPAFLEVHEVYVACIDDRPVGFYALREASAWLRLEHLWVMPEAMGRGVGRALFCHAAGRMKSLKFDVLEIESDPNAAGFYQRMGAQRAGTHLTQVDGQRRELPVLVYRIEKALDPPSGS